ncbi:MAG: sulfate reduction electron transfer complex DsrMKJOP subunit DsrO [Planctomycetota bacterium]|jgi:molybdopterin-containing oxidoreductase family iron-sulfur binding subunit
MEESRREFLKKAGFLTLGVGFGLPLVGSAVKGSLGIKASNQLGMVIDIRKCLDEKVRHACTEACHREHNVPQIPDPEEEVKWIWSEAYEHVFPDRAHGHTQALLKRKPVLVLCNHCSSPPCVKVCPTQATFKRESDGIVTMDMHRCIGCRYCIAACPYGARSFNWRDPNPHVKGPIRPEYPTRDMGTVEKCNFCAERLRESLEPACVEAAGRVPGGKGALTFGNLSDPNSEVSRLLRERHSLCRRVSLGAGPNVYYIV